MGLLGKNTSTTTIILITACCFWSSRPSSVNKFNIDQKESVVSWSGAMAFGDKNGHTGYISISNGELTVEKDRLVGGFVEIDMNSISDKVHGADNGLVNHLKDPDFFDVKKFPVSIFTITKVDATEGNMKVTGDLTIKGITKPVTFPAKFKLDGDVIHSEGKLVIDRTLWDVRYKSSKFFSYLADEAIADFIYFEMRIIARK